jgi:hypothetical protein
MSGHDDALQWHEMAEHLVQAHGAAADRLIGYAPTLEQLRFAHADTHIALAVEDAQPPDGHVHSLPLDGSWPAAQERSYRPFPRSPSTADNSLAWPCPEHTGLHHHVITLSGDRAHRIAEPLFVKLLLKKSISPEDLAAARAAARRARADFPRPVQTRRSSRPGCSVPAAPRRASASTASAVRQAHQRSLR